ncbi:hypothetical protein PHMEG_00034420, partial [Phytophthora megakarya]
LLFPFQFLYPGVVQGLQVEVVLGLAKPALVRRLQSLRLRAPGPALSPHSGGSAPGPTPSSSGTPGSGDSGASLSGAAESGETPVPPPSPLSVPGRYSTPQGNPAKTPKHIRFDDLPDDEDDVLESLPQEAPQDDYEMGSGMLGLTTTRKRTSGTRPDGQRQVRPRVYTPQTDHKGLFYRDMDDDAEPPRSDEDLSTQLPADAELSDTAADIMVRASLRRDILCEIIRRLLWPWSLDEVDWLRQFPEEYFERAYKCAEDSDWVIGVEHP